MGKYADLLEKEGIELLPHNPVTNENIGPAQPHSQAQKKPNRRLNDSVSKRAAYAAYNLAKGVWDNKWEMMISAGIGAATKAAVVSLFGAAATALTAPAIFTAAGIVVAGATAGAATSIFRAWNQRRKQKIAVEKHNKKELARYKFGEEFGKHYAMKEPAYDIQSPWLTKEVVLKGIAFGAVFGALGSIGFDLFSGNNEAIAKTTTDAAKVLVTEPYDVASTLDGAVASNPTSATDIINNYGDKFVSFVDNKALPWLSNSWATLSENTTSWKQSIADFFSTPDETINEVKETVATATQTAVEDNSADYLNDPAKIAEFSGGKTPEEIVKGLIEKPTETGIEIDEVVDKNHPFIIEGENTPFPEIILPEVPASFSDTITAEQFALLPENLQDYAERATQSGDPKHIMRFCKDASAYLLNDAENGSREAVAALLTKGFDAAHENMILAIDVENGLSLEERMTLMEESNKLINSSTGQQTMRDLAYIYSRGIGVDVNFEQATRFALMLNEDSGFKEDWVKFIGAKDPAMLEEIQKEMSIYHEGRALTQEPLPGPQKAMPKPPTPPDSLLANNTKLSLG